MSAKVDVTATTQPAAPASPKPGEPGYRAPNKPAERHVLHFVSDTRKPLRVKNHQTGVIRSVAYGEYVPEATDWPENVQHSHLRLGILRRVDGPPAGYKPPKAPAPAAEKKAGVKPDDDPMFAGAPKKGT